MTTYATYFHPPAVGHERTFNAFTDTHPVSNVYHPTHINEPTQSSPLQTRRRTLTMSRNLSGTINPQDKSLFFRFPAELRNLVYKELLCPDATSLKEMEKGDLDLSVRRFNKTSTKTSLHPAILSTCRRIHEEATQMLYTPHIFHAHPTLLTSMPHLCSSSKPVLYTPLTSMITRWQLCLRLDTDPRFTYEQATAAFSGAEYLEIRVWQAQFEACDYAVLKLFTGVRGVQVARVGGSVDPKLARWLEEVMMKPIEKTCACEDECSEECVQWEQEREVLCGRGYKKMHIG